MINISQLSAKGTEIMGLTSLLSSLWQTRKAIRVPVSNPQNVNKVELTSPNLQEKIPGKYI